MAILRSSATRIGCTALSIPTCSGISHFHQLRRILRTVVPRHWSAWLYPRSRGENLLLKWRACRSAGSSPLTRGKLRCTGIPIPGRRLIPAHAGKTKASLKISSRLAAHPRSRGKNSAVPCLSYPVVGSSPLTRGKPSRRVTFPLTVGLIPAHAGKTSHLGAQIIHCWAHPRSRGENDLVAP